MDARVAVSARGQGGELPSTSNVDGGLLQDRVWAAMRGTLARDPVEVGAHGGAGELRGEIVQKVMSHRSPRSENPRPQAHHAQDLGLTCATLRARSTGAAHDFQPMIRSRPGAARTLYFGPPGAASASSGCARKRAPPRRPVR